MTASVHIVFTVISLLRIENIELNWNSQRKWEVWICYLKI